VKTVNIKGLAALGLIVYASLFLNGCRTTKDVMPGENGINRVSLKTSDGDGGRNKAVKEAKRYCSKRNQEAIFLSDKTEYKGTMDEETRNTIRNASTAAMVVGGMAQSGAVTPLIDPAGVLPAAGMAGHIMTSNNDYQTEVKFKCQ
jgi:hypothetical protein